MDTVKIATAVAVHPESQVSLEFKDPPDRRVLLDHPAFRGPKGLRVLRARQGARVIQAMWEFQALPAPEDIQGPTVVTGSSACLPISIMASILDSSRNVFSIRYQTVQGCVFSGMVLFASITAMHAADDGISNSMVPSALPPRRLMEWFTWYTETAPRKIYTACGKSKACARKYPKVSCAWNCGSVTVLATDPLMHTQAGTQCPGFTWKKYHLHRLNSIRCETRAKKHLNLITAFNCN